MCPVWFKQKYTKMKQLAFNSFKGNTWLEGLFGLEKENLRVDQAGNLAPDSAP